MAVRALSLLLSCSLLSVAELSSMSPTHEVYGAQRAGRLVPAGGQQAQGLGFAGPLSPLGSSVSWGQGKVCRLNEPKGIKGVREAQSLRVQMGPAKGEVRNPWGRAGKPETRIQRAKEAEERATVRATAWRKALQRGDWGEFERADWSISPTENIDEFHDRAAQILRDCGGRANSLTFSYKWKQQFGENLRNFVEREQLDVSAMLKMSNNRFLVVDMQTPSSSAEEEVDECNHLQVYLLNEKANVEQNGRGQPLGDQLGVYGESAAIKAWRLRRATTTMSRSDALVSDSSAKMVALSHEQDSAELGDANASADAKDRTSNTRGMTCMKLPANVDKIQDLGKLLDVLEPLTGGLDSRLGLRQMHLAWSSRCTCAASAVKGLQKVAELQHTAKRRQLKRVDELVKSLADVVQAGMSSLTCDQIAGVLGAIDGRSGHDTLVFFASNRVVQGGQKFIRDARNCSPEAISVFVTTMARYGQRDPLLYRQLGSACLQIPAERYTAAVMAEILDGMHSVGVHDTTLMRYFTAALQQLPVASLDAHGTAGMAMALAKWGTNDDAAFRRLSTVVMQLPDSAFDVGSIGKILYGFALSGIKDPALVARLSTIVRGLDSKVISIDDAARIVSGITGGASQDTTLLQRMGQTILETRVSSLTHHHIGVIAKAFADADYHSVEVFDHLTAAALKLEPWSFDIQAVAMIVQAYVKLGIFDKGLFGRLSTVLQQMDPVSFRLQDVSILVTAYTLPEVQDKALLGKLATILQQMDASIFSTSDAVQEVSIILNAFASADMKDLALSLSQVLGNHLKSHGGGLTAQAMANIVLRVGIA